MSLSWVFVIIMVTIAAVTAAGIIRWMKSPNDQYDDFLEKLARGEDVK